jgi:single-strand DNA-binding protein
MAGETVITVVGNLTADPELRFTPSGAAVANFTVASTPRTFDRQSQEWKDGEALFLRCNVWRQAAENVAESLTRGSRVIVSGRLKQRSFETKEGEKRTVVELEVDEIGPSLRYATAKVANFTVASTPRTFDRQSQEWKDGEALFLRCNVWRQAAENVAESLQRGMRVIASGRLKSRSYETKEGEKRTVVELDVDEIGPSLRSATAKVNKTQRGGGGGFGGGGSSDPWSTPAPPSDEPPF